MMLPFGVVVVVTQAHGYIGVDYHHRLLCGCALLSVQRSLSALQDLLVVGLSHFRCTALDTGMVQLVSELRSLVRYTA